MIVEDLYRYAYRKQPLRLIYLDREAVPFEFLAEWDKEAAHYPRRRFHNELLETDSVTPEQILNWLEEVVEFLYQASKAAPLPPTAARRGTATRSPIRSRSTGSGSTR